MPAGIFQRMILGMGLVAPPDAEAVAALLVMGREAAGLTQGRLASRLSELAGAPISQGYVSKVEAGVLTVDPGRLPLFAAVLGLTPGFFCRYERDSLGTWRRVETTSANARRPA